MSSGYLENLARSIDQALRTKFKFGLFIQLHFTQLFSANPTIFLEIFKLVLQVKTWKKCFQKLLIIGPIFFFFQYYLPELLYNDFACDADYISVFISEKPYDQGIWPEFWPDKNSWLSLQKEFHPIFWQNSFYPLRCCRIRICASRFITFLDQILCLTKHPVTQCPQCGIFFFIF